MNELTISLQTDSTTHLYEQIYTYIKNEIREGRLLRGEKLPSTRILAQHLQVSRSTVNLAYEQLLSEGYIEAAAYKGYFVCQIEELYELKSVDQIVPEEKETERYDIDFSPNGIDMRAFPFGVWKKITKSTLMDDKNEMFELGFSKGDLALRKTISKYLHSARGVVCEPEQIVVGAGNDYLLMLLEKILGKKKTVAMENPTYMRAYRIFSSFAYEIRTISMDDSGMQIADLMQSGADIAYVMPSHQYPTGVVMPIGRRMELLKWAADEGRFLIEDDYDSEFRYKGKPIPALFSSDTNNKVIYLGTFSKSIAPAIRVSYLVLPKSLLPVYEKNCSFFSSTVSRIDQTILNEFISQGFYERHLNKMRKIYKAKHDIMLQELAVFDKKFKTLGEHAGLHLLLQSKTEVTEEELIQKAKREGIKVYGMSSALITHRNMPSTIILGYAGLCEDEIINGLKRLKNVYL